MFQLSNRRGGSAIRAAVVASLLLWAHGAMAQTIRMWSFMNPTGKSPRELVMKKLMDRFEAANPGVKILSEPQNPVTMADKFFAAHQTGSAPDVIWIYTSRTYDAVKLGALANLDDLFLKTWSKDDIADVDGPLWRFAAAPDAHYQIMHSRSVMGQFYRVDLFRDAGIDPKSLTTWDKFIAAAQKLTTKDAEGKPVRWGFGQQYAGALPNAPTLFSVLLDQDGAIFDKNFRAAWASPAGVLGVQMEVDMIRKYGIMPETVVTMNFDDLYEQFGAGRFAMIRGAAARIPAAVAVLGAGKVGYLPTPSFVEGKHSSTEVAGWSVGVWSGTKQKELAGKWLEYISSKEADTIWATEAGVLPIRKSTIANNAAFFANPANAFLADASADILEHGWIQPPGSGSSWDEGLNAALQDVATNHMEPKAALAALRRASALPCACWQR